MNSIDFARKRECSIKCSSLFFKCPHLICSSVIAGIQLERSLVIFNRRRIISDPHKIKADNITKRIFLIVHLPPQVRDAGIWTKLAYHSLISGFCPVFLFDGSFYTVFIRVAFFHHSCSFLGLRSSIIFSSIQ